MDTERTKTVKAEFSSVIIIIASIMIYFQIYWHYWLVKLLNNYVINTLLPIGIILYYAVFRKNFFKDFSYCKKNKTIFILIMLISLYLLLASFSILLNEKGFIAVKRYFIYIYSPILIFIGIFFLPFFYRKNENIVYLIKILFFVGIIFSIYVAYQHLNPQLLERLLPLKTNRGIIDAKSGGGYGVGGLVIPYRFTIPGLGSTSQYGPILVPLIVLGIYFILNSKKTTKLFYSLATVFLYFCLCMTVSRGPFIAFLIALTYLISYKAIKLKKDFSILFIIILSFFTFAKLMLYRLIITLAIFLPIDLTFMANYANDLKKDTRIMAYSDYSRDFSGTASNPAAYDLNGSTGVVPIADTAGNSYGIPNKQKLVFKPLLFGIGYTNFTKLREIGNFCNNYLIVYKAFGGFVFLFYVFFILFFYIQLNLCIRNLSMSSPERSLGIFLTAATTAFIFFLNVSFCDMHYIWIWFGLTAAWLRNCILGKQPNMTSAVKGGNV